jgi:hypothetical protein
MNHARLRRLFLSTVHATKRYFQAIQLPRLHISSLSGAQADFSVDSVSRLVVDHETPSDVFGMAVYVPSSQIRAEMSVLLSPAPNGGAWFRKTRHGSTTSRRSVTRRSVARFLHFCTGIAVADGSSASLMLDGFPPQTGSNTSWIRIVGKME